MKKILLTSGSSFGFDFFKPDDTESVSFKKWPDLLSEKLDTRLINKSKPGASNLYIYDHLMENIIKHGDNIELVVASWSYGFKTSIFRNFEINLINLEDQDWGDQDLIEPAEVIKEKLLSNSLFFSSIEQTLRLMIYLQDTCDSKNIKCIHYPLLNIFKSPFDKVLHYKFLEQIMNSEHFERINLFNNVIGWPCDINLGGYTYNVAHPNKIISNDNHHPNEEGQKIIAQEIYDKYLKLTGTQHD